MGNGVKSSDVLESNVGDRLAEQRRRGRRLQRLGAGQREVRVAIRGRGPRPPR